MYRSAKRIYRILAVVIRYGLDAYLPNQGVFRVVRLLAYLHPSHYKRDATDYSLGTRLRLSLEALGPVFVKLGQTLSTRPDLFPADMVLELSKLQDKVPPFPAQQAKAIVEENLEEPIETVFSNFDAQAMASASVAQVHAATLLSGEEVVVKLLRPNVREMAGKDINLMYTIARLLSHHRDGRRLRLVEVVAEFEHTMDNELDLMFEAANGSQLKANFSDSELLHVPKIYWEYCRHNMMVQERIYGVNIADMTAINAVNTNMQVLAERGVEIFFTQVFRDSFFHADMHPGNIFVDISNPQVPKYCAVDFGIMGSLTPEDQHYLAENFLAFFNRDYRRVAMLHIESGWVPHNTRVTDFEAAIRKVSEPIFGKPIKDISFGTFLLSLFQTARRFNMEVQPQLILLQKTFFNVEGLGRRLYPELDLWKTAKPVLEDWMKGQVGPRSALKKLRHNAHEYSIVLPKIPLLAAEVLEQVADDYRHQPKNSGKTVSSPINLRPLSGALMLIASAILSTIEPNFKQIGVQEVMIMVLVVAGIWQLFSSARSRE